MSKTIEESNVSEREFEGDAGAVEYFRDVLTSSLSSVCVYDADWNWLAFNSAFEVGFPRLFGVSPKIGGNLLHVLAEVGPESAAAAKRFLDGIKADPRPVVALMEARIDEGAAAVIEQSFTPLTWSDGSLRAVLVVGRLSQAEMPQRQIESRFEAIFNQAGTGIAQLGLNRRVTRVNGYVADLLGYADSELCGLSLGDLVWAEDAAIIDAALKRLYESRDGVYPPFEARLRHRGGSRVDVEIQASLVRDMPSGVVQCLLVALRDIGPHKRAEADLRAALNERETLLREVHHRVKNNLQMISSLLTLEGFAAKDRGFADRLRLIDEKIRVVARIHEQLYSRDDMISVELGEQVGGLAHDIASVFAGGRVSVSTEVEEIDVPVDIALPLGLILNELLSNSFKYGFAEDRQGVLRLRLRRAAQGLVLELEEIGATPLPADFPPKAEGTGLGYKLITSLTAQLHGTFAAEPRPDGKLFRLTVPL